MKKDKQMVKGYWSLMLKE